VFHPLQNLKAPFQNTVRLPSPYIGDKPDAAGIALIFPSVKAFPGTLVRPLSMLIHNKAPLSPSGLYASAAGRTGGTPARSEFREVTVHVLRDSFQYTKKWIFMQGLRRTFQQFQIQLFRNRKET
jgi:hypothetical protein